MQAVTYMFVPNCCWATGLATAHNKVLRLKLSKRLVMGKESFKNICWRGMGHPANQRRLLNTPQGPSPTQPTQPNHPTHHLTTLQDHLPFNPLKTPQTPPRFESFATWGQTDRQTNR